MTQEDFFGFLSRPFQAAPQEGQFVPLEPMNNAIEQLVTAARKGDGIGVLTAMVGAGKTVVCYELKSRLIDEFVTVLLPSCTYPTRRSLLQAILFQLDEDFYGLTEQEARLRLLSVAQASLSNRAGILLIVDEAHQLSPRLLEELRCLTNHVEDGQPLIRIILSGQLALEERLTLPELQALNYRITCHTTLEPLTIHESAAFIDGRLSNMGQQAKNLFTQESLEIICRVSDGSPRCLNQITDACLTYAAETKTIPVTDSVVRTVLQTLKQLPLQWNESVCDQVLMAGSRDFFNEHSADEEMDDASLSENEADQGAIDEVCSHSDADFAGSHDDPLSDPDWMLNVTSIEVGADQPQSTKTDQQESQSARIRDEGTLEQQPETQQSHVIEIGSAHDALIAVDEQSDSNYVEIDRKAMNSHIELQELTVDDPYAALDRHCERQTQASLRDDPSLIVNWNQCGVPTTENAIHEQANDVAANTGHTVDDQISQAIAEFESLPTSSRIGRMIKALSDVVANELSRDLGQPTGRSHFGRIVRESDTGDASTISEVQTSSGSVRETTKWRATPDPMAFDIIEPESHEDAQAIESAAEKADLEIFPWEHSVRTAEEVQPSDHSERMEEAESVSNHVDDAHPPVERPYARLFSRVRRKRTSA
ncbi:MAG: AAA family ATPase [Planctomycetaceae bacterium]|nr:AAA family ATPase [Planctomycetaceae bacterium]